MRTDVVKIKADLTTALGDKNDEYWHALKAFIKGESTRLEFDILATQHLGKTAGTWGFRLRSRQRRSNAT
jgi:hypothetical protein